MNFVNLYFNHSFLQFKKFCGKVLRKFPLSNIFENKIPGLFNRTVINFDIISTEDERYIYVSLNLNWLSCTSVARPSAYGSNRNAQLKFTIQYELWILKRV